MLGGWLFALVLTIVAGLLLVADEFMSLPGVLLALGLGGFLLGTMLVFVLAVAGSQRTGQGIIRSLWGGTTTSLRWLWEFLP
jgi:hypothetical protein